MTRRKKVPDMPPVEMVSMSDIRLAEDNPRKIPDSAVQMVALSLQRFGWKQPVVLDKDGVLIVGHTRYLAARSLKQRRLPAIRADDLSEDEVRAYRIADNRTHDFTSWDFAALVPQLDELAPEFSDVLGLQDWEAITEEFNAQLELSSDVLPHMDVKGGGFRVTLVFTDEESALAAEESLLEIEGVIDVLHSR